MKNITVIVFAVLCSFLVLGTATSFRRTRRDVFAGTSARRNAEEEIEFNPKIEDDSNSEDDDDIDIRAEEKSVEARQVVLVDNNMTTFFNLLEEAGLLKSFDSINNVKLFAPTDEALANPETAAKLENLRSDKDKLRDVLLFHMTQTKLENCDEIKYIEVKSELSDKSIRINKVSRQWDDEKPRFRAECANILHFDNNSCNEKVSEIDRLLLPPTKSVYDIIQSDPKYSALREVLQETMLEELLNNKSPITFLAPVNEAFEKLQGEKLQSFRNKSYASIVLGQHILPGMFCSADLGRYQKPFYVTTFETLHGSTMRIYAYRRPRYIRQTPDYSLMDKENVVDWDIMATNGIIHSVDKLMMVGS